MRVAPGHPRIRMRLLPFHDRSHGSGGTDPYAEPGTLAEIGRFAPGAQVGLRRGRIGNQGENVTAQTGERFCPTGGRWWLRKVAGAGSSNGAGYSTGGLGVRCFYETLYRRQSCEPLRSRIWSWEAGRNHRSRVVVGRFFRIGVHCGQRPPGRLFFFSGRHTFG